MTPHENTLSLFLKRDDREGQKDTGRQTSIRLDDPFPKERLTRSWEAARFPVRPSGPLICTADPLVCVHGPGSLGAQTRGINAT